MIITGTGSLLAMGSMYVLWSREMDLSDDAWITVASLLVLLAALLSISYSTLKVAQEKTKVWLTPLLVLLCNSCLFVLGVVVDVLAIQDDLYYRNYYPSGLFVLLMGIAMPIGMIRWHWSWSSTWETSLSRFIFRFCCVGLYGLLLLWAVFGLYLSTLDSL